MAVLEPPYTQYPTQQSAPEEAPRSPRFLPSGESDSGLPGSAGTPSNFITDLLGPRYQKYAYPPIQVSSAGPPRRSSAE